MTSREVINEMARRAYEANLITDEEIKKLTKWKLSKNNKRHYSRTFEILKYGKVKGVCKGLAGWDY